MKTGYCGASDFKMQEGRMGSTTLISIEDDLTLNINSTLVMIQFNTIYAIFTLKQTLQNFYI